MRRMLSTLDRATFMGGFYTMQADLAHDALGFLEFENRSLVSRSFLEWHSLASREFSKGHEHLPTTCRSETRDCQPLSLQHGPSEHLWGSAVNGRVFGFSLLLPNTWQNTSRKGSCWLLVVLGDSVCHDRKGLVMLFTPW